MTNKFDLIVIGTGTAGMTVANKCKEEGLTVAIIDEKPFGGTCALRGCDPKKVLLGVAEIVDQVNRLQGKGISGKVKINWKELMSFKEEFTSHVPDEREKHFKDKEIKMFHGTAHFSSENSVKVKGEELTAKYFLIATGASAADLPFEGANFLLDNEEFLKLTCLPKKILFVGGGYISMEFSHLVARAGAEVTVVNHGQRILKKFDPFLVSLLEEHSRKLGIKILNNSIVDGVIQSNDGFKVKIKTNDQMIYEEVDLVIHGAGRVPNIDKLKLDIAGIEFDKEGIKVNEFGQSISNPSVFAAGDASKSGLPLTPVASFEAHIVASNIIHGNTKKIEYPPIPSVAFTIPQIASVGLTESEAHAEGIEFKVHNAKTSDWFSAKRIGEEYEAYKIILSKDEKRILGAHLLGHKAEEVINLFAMAIELGIEAVEIKKMIMAYPTSSSNISSMI